MEARRTFGQRRAKHRTKAGLARADKRRARIGQRRVQGGSPTRATTSSSFVVPSVVTISARNAPSEPYLAAYAGAGVTQGRV